MKTETVNTPLPTSARLAERRAVPRIPWKGTAILRFDSQEREYLGAIRDVSPGGCGIEVGSGIPAPAGTSVSVELHTHSEPLRRRGIVRRVQRIRTREEETCVGIEFRAPLTADAMRAFSVWES